MVTMKKYVTIVIEYEDESEIPKIGFQEEILGGVVIAFMFGDVLETLCRIAKRWNPDEDGE